MIKQVALNDITDCVNLIRESFGTVAEAFGLTPENASRFTAFSTNEERLLWHLEHEHRPMFAFYEKSVLAGYYSLQLKRDHVCELNNLCVAPAFRHNGIGKALLKHASSTARALGCSTMVIGIMEENRILRAWYEAFGFVHTGTKKFDFFPFTCGYMEKSL